MQQLPVVIAFKQQGIATGEPAHDMRRDRTRIGQYADAGGTIAKHVLTRFARIMGYGKGLYLKIPNGDLFVRRERVHVRQRSKDGLCRRQCAMGQVYGKFIASRHRADTAYMVTVFVRDKNCGEIVRIGSQRGTTFDGDTKRKSTIQQNGRVPAANQRRISLTAAAKQGKRQILSCGRW